MSLVLPPIDKVRVVTPYPDGRASSAQTDAVGLKDLILPGKPFVLHLYTG